MYRFVLRPRWLVGHVLIAIAVTAMVALGFWQLRRLGERRELVALVEQRSHATIPLDDAPADPDSAQFLRARAVGTYDPRHEVLLRFRSRAGTPGHNVLTPLVTADGSAIVVNRGWIPLEMAERWPTAEGRAPGGTVEVEGVLRRGERASGFKPAGEAGSPQFIGSIDLVSLRDHIPHRLRSVYLQELGPERDSFPVPLPPPETGQGPHLSYALQWFAFSTIFAGGWVLLLRSQARRPAPTEEAGWEVADQSVHSPS